MATLFTIVEIALTNQSEERILGAQGWVRETHLLRVHLARATTVLRAVTVVRAASLASPLLFGTHTPTGFFYTSTNENPLISNRSPWQRNIFTVNIRSRVIANVAAPLFCGVREYFRCQRPFDAGGIMVETPAGFRPLWRTPIVPKGARELAFFI